MDKSKQPKNTLRDKKNRTRKKQVYLNRLGNSRNEIEGLRKRLLELLAEQLFRITSFQNLLYNVLNLINPVNKTLINTEQSIENACGYIIRHFKMNMTVKSSVLTDDGWKEVKSRPETNTEKFSKWILWMNKAPGQFYMQLSEQAKEDLTAITELAKWYETQPCIQKYMKGQEVPKAHEERIIFDFYQRCVSERIEILNFFLYRIKDRALEKARADLSLAGTIWSINSIFRDRPYYFGRHGSVSYFDCRKIELAFHRTAEMPYTRAEQMQRLYEKNKALFYRRYFKEIPAKQHFQSIRFYLPYLPLNNDRSHIFAELEKTYKAGRWISFYALALPQVEGLFSEMCQTLFPEKDFSRKALPYKVDTVRPFHLLNRSYFDYYQYHIPLLRNRFAHTGYDEDFKLKSFDLLVDLCHLLKVFYELNNPLVEIKKLHTRRNPEDFNSLGNIAAYFRLLDSLKPQQKSSIKHETWQFEREFLCGECDIEQFCYEMAVDLPGTAEEVKNAIIVCLNKHKVNTEFNKLKNGIPQSIIENKELTEDLWYSFIYKRELTERLNDYLLFLLRYKKYLTGLKSDIKKKLEELSAIYLPALTVIKYLDDQIKKLNEEDAE